MNTDNVALGFVCQPMTGLRKIKVEDENNRHNKDKKTNDPLGPNSEIGQQLRAFYLSVQEEAIPDKFLDLLEKLDQAEQKLNMLEDEETQNVKGSSSNE